MIYTLSVSGTIVVFFSLPRMMSLLTQINHMLKKAYADGLIRLLAYEEMYFIKHLVCTDTILLHMLAYGSIKTKITLIRPSISLK